MGTSQAQPGYVLKCQVPPTSSPRSSTVKSSIPSCLRRIAMPRPEKPLPTIPMSMSKLSMISYIP